MKKMIGICLLLTAFWGCATFSRSYRLGTEAYMNRDWDAAIEYYEKASLEDPKNSVYRLALTRTRISASQFSLGQARNLARQGERDAALTAYERALSYDPQNYWLNQEIRRFQDAALPEEEPAEPAPIEPPVKLAAGEERIVLKFLQEVSLRSIFQALGKYAGINMIFDESFRDKPFAIDMSDQTFVQALNTLCLATKNFHRVIDEHTVLVVPDMPANRLKYELVGVRTFYLSNINAQEIQQHIMQQIRSQTKIPTVTVDKALNSITIRDTPAKLELAEQLLRMWDKPLGEVMVDLEIMEVSRQTLKTMGLDFSSRSLSLNYDGGGAVSEAGTLPLAGLDFGTKSNYQITLPTALLDFLETDTDTKLISQPRLRGLHGEKMEYIVGDEVPIPQTTFSPIAAGGVSQQPITSFQYKDVGIEVYITPRLHSEGEVTMELEVNVKALGGTGYGDLPIISARKVKNVIRLRDGETNLLAGLLKDEERKTLKGIAGIKSIPLLGALFSNNDQTIQQTDVILTITPHIIRGMPVEPRDTQPLWIPLEDSVSGRGGGAASVADLDAVPTARGLEDRPDEPSGASRITITPPRFEGPQNRNFRINVGLQAREEIQNMSLTISYDAQVIHLKQIDRGNVIQRLGEKPAFLENIDNAGGMCTVGFSTDQVAKGFQGSGRVVTLVFEPVAQGESSITVSAATAHGPSGQPVMLETGESRIRVR
jgi:general secretion pathway protein D